MAGSPGLPAWSWRRTHPASPWVRRCAASGGAGSTPGSSTSTTSGSPTSTSSGIPNLGLGQFLRTLEVGRISIAALSLSLTQAVLDLALTYAKGREQFGQPISKFQAVQFKLADIATELEAARWLTYRAASLRDAGQPFQKEAAMAKMKASRVAAWAASEAVQIHGGLGYMLETPVARFYCDSKVLEIGEGTNEIQHLVIARQLGC